MLEPIALRRRLKNLIQQYVDSVPVLPRYVVVDMWCRELHSKTGVSNPAQLTDEQIPVAVELLVGLIKKAQARRTQAGRAKAFIRVTTVGGVL